eukprot:10924702-Heterocapsa_arctica.AAC.1
MPPSGSSTGRSVDSFWVGQCERRHEDLHAAPREQHQTQCRLVLEDVVGQPERRREDLHAAQREQHQTQ